MLGKSLSPDAPKPVQQINGRYSALLIWRKVFPSSVGRATCSIPSESSVLQ